MKRHILSFSIIALSLCSISAQIDLWNVADESELNHRSASQKWSSPSAFGLYKVEIDQMRNELAAVPHEDNVSSRSSKLTFNFPMPDGSLRSFQMVEYQMVEPKLARKFPHIKTYIGVDLNHGSKIHVNLSKNQLFAVIREQGETYYIDPYSRSDHNYYMSYNIRDNHREDYQFECGVHEIVDGAINEKEDENQVNLGHEDNQLHSRFRGAPLALRTYRLAVSATFEFTGFYGGTVSGAIDGIVTIVNRINSVYERDAAIRLILVGNNDQVVFTTAVDDPFVDGNLVQMINQNQLTQDAAIGPGNYDIGHVLGRAGYEGRAQLGAVCGGSKARGGSVANTPFGDAFTINIICHEMGHQFSATHTMYHCHNVINSTSYEPGSGSTIMSYAGICSSVANIKNNADDYFHTNSLDNIIGFSRSGGGSACGTDINFGNTYPDPILNYPTTTRIPVNTAFRLTGSASDAENSSTLTYNWEQYQTGPRDFESSPWDITQPTGNEPLFRSVPPSTDPTRYFPALPIIVNGTNYLFEQLPSYARDLVFRFNVRDNAPENGGTAWSTMRMEVHDNSAFGQFEITNFIIKDTIVAGGYEELTWTVAGTTDPPFHTEFVDIYLSTDGGNSFPHLVKSNTKNDGSAFVNIPNLPADRFRFMIVASNSVYLDVSDRSGVIADVEDQAIGLNYDDQHLQICAPDVVDFDISSYGLGGFNSNVHFDLSAPLPPGATVNFINNDSPAGGTTMMRLDLRNVTAEGDFEIQIQATGDNVQAVDRSIDITVVNSNFDALQLTSPVDGITGVGFVPSLMWVDVPNASSYTVELSDDPTFAFIIYTADINVNQVTLDLQLTAGEVYFWRVLPRNACGTLDLNQVSSFQVQSLSCDEFCSTQSSIVLSASGMPSAIMDINTGSSITANDFNVTSIVGRHSDMGDVRLTVEGPSGTQVVMMIEETCRYVNSDINMGFDDDAAIVNPNCINFNDGIRFVPDNPLSALNGETGSSYRLIMNDTRSGSGGRLDSWCFEICGNIAPEAPLLALLDSIHLPALASRIISADKLEVTHSQFAPEDLVITIVEAPNHGVLTLDGMPINAGSQLTMADVNNARLSYQNQDPLYDSDNFSFIVTDPGGGYLGTPTMNIIVGLVAVQNQLPEGSELLIYPNPTKSMVNIELKSDELDLDAIYIYSITGQRLAAEPDIHSNQVAINLELYPRGLYLLKVQTGEYTITKKVVKQ